MVAVYLKWIDLMMRDSGKIGIHL